MEEGTGTRPSDGTDPRSEAARAADHAAVARLADTLLPALMAKLGASHLGELEVREGEWHVRLRRPSAEQRRNAERAEKVDRQRHGHAGGHGGGSGHASPSTHGAEHGGNGTGHADPPEPELPVATSPAVGVFQAGRGTTAGSTVRAGDRIAIVDVLGVPTDVVSPVDGRVVEVLAETGTAVEYGQPLVRFEPEGGAR